MKMGDFCKNFDINSDTVRYYIDEGLLAPRKRNNRYEFTDNDLRDMESINKYKDLNFSIKQIAQIMSYSRISIDEKSIYASFIMGFYKKKETELLEEKKHIENALELLQNDIKELNSISKMKKEKVGIPFDFFQYLECPKCGKNLLLNDAEVKNSCIFEGKLNCECGYEANIIDGIIYTPSSVKRFEEDFDYVNFKKNYVGKIESKFTSKIYTIGRQLFDEIKKEDRNDKVILEFGVGFGTFFSHAKNEFLESKFYILNDIDSDIIKATKSYFENTGENPRIIYICSDIRNIPIKKHSVDYFINFFSMMEYFLYLNSTNDYLEYYYKDIVDLLAEDNMLFELHMFIEKYKGKLEKDFLTIEKFFFEDNLLDELEKNDIEVLRKPLRTVTDVIGDVKGIVKEGSNIIMESFISKHIKK